MFKRLCKYFSVDSLFSPLAFFPSFLLSLIQPSVVHPVFNMHAAVSERAAHRLLGERAAWSQPRCRSVGLSESGGKIKYLQPGQVMASQRFFFSGMINWKSRLEEKERGRHQLGRSVCVRTRKKAHILTDFGAMYMSWCMQRRWWLGGLESVLVVAAVDQAVCGTSRVESGAYVLPAADGKSFLIKNFCALVFLFSLQPAYVRRICALIARSLVRQFIHILHEQALLYTASYPYVSKSIGCLKLALCLSVGSRIWFWGWLAWSHFNNAWGYYWYYVSWLGGGTLLLQSPTILKYQKQRYHVNIASVVDTAGTRGLGTSMSCNNL